MQFKDLGLVVIDEEQRFGVKHKEVFKRCARTVDVLSMSATPIPRTLYLALTGARDLSVIETRAGQPPSRSRPSSRPTTKRSSSTPIRHEIRRGGQVFYLHNRVATIDLVAGAAARTAARPRHRRRPRPDGRGRAGADDDGFRRGQVPGAGLHDDHRERPRYPELQHDHHRGRGPLRPVAALPAARAGRAGSSTRPTPTCCCTGTRACWTSPASG